jgi:phage/plasmid-associated DNA primase
MLRSAFDATTTAKLVSMLSPGRAEGYEDWMRVGWCLHSISSGLESLKLWSEFSRSSSKFEEGLCERLWNQMEDRGLTIASLHMWARMDSPYEYKTFVNSLVHREVEACNGTHNSVASIAYKVLKGKYVCATANGRLWYEFGGTLWQEDKEGIHMRHDLSTTVREQFLLTVNRVSSTFSIDDLETASKASTSRTVNQNKQLCETLLKVAFKLQDSGFKDSVVKEMREYFFDASFMRKLDGDPNLIAFTNGVWDLKLATFRAATPEDYVSLSVGFAYTPESAETRETYTKMVAYMRKLHPDPGQYSYVIKTFARQLQGDAGHNLFHVHAGYQGTAGNGKTTFFDVLEMCLGSYIRKFGVEMLTAKQRVETGKPMPEFQYWKGVRILYCTEPKHDDVLNTGIMKDLTGGEKIMYRLLFSNDVVDFRPQFKMHIMCNDAPQVDGSDSGVKRRIRKLDYLAQFVSQEQVDEAKHCYLRDDRFIGEMRVDPRVKMEFLRLLLNEYDHEYAYDMPAVVQRNSTMYIEENDAVFKFASECIEKSKDAYFTLKEAKDAFKSSEHYNGKAQTLKNDLQKLLKTPCEDQKKIGGKKYNYVFWGYKLVGEDWAA